MKRSPRHGPASCGRGLRLLALVVGMAFGGPALAVPEWRMFRAADGLSESLSTAITISPRGNVWVKHGEVNALSVLDGYTVQRIPAPFERIYRAYQSRTGRVWALYEEGLLVYSGETWTRYPLSGQLSPGELNQLRAGRTPSLHAVEGERVLLVFPERLIQFRALDQSVMTLRRAQDSPFKRFIDLTPTPGGALWLTGEEGVSRSAVPARDITPESPWIDLMVPSALGVTGLHRAFADDDGGLTMIGDQRSSERRLLVHLSGTNWMSLSVTNENLRFAWRDAASNVFWGLTLNRLLRLTGDRVEAVTPPFPVSQYLDVAVQPRGVFWLATREGLLRQAPSAWRSPELPVESPGPVHGAVVDTAGDLWIAAEAGLFSQVQGRWRRHAWPEGVEQVFRPQDGFYGLPGGNLLATVSGSPWKFDAARNQFEAVTPPPGRELVRVLKGGPTNGVVFLTRARAGDAGSAQLELYDGRQFTALPDAPELPATGGDLFFLERSRNGDWWLGTSGGPAWFHDGRWQFFGAADGYADDGAFCWLEMDDERIWCAGLGKVQEFDGKRWSVLCAGLDRVRALCRGSDGTVWAPAGDGLFRRFREAWLSVGESEGLPSSAARCVVEDGNRRIWVGTALGLSYHVPRADVDPPRTLTAKWENERSGSGESGGRISFEGHDKWRFTVDERLVFSHRLDGGEWSPYSGATTLQLRELSQGRHRFEVRAMDRNWNVESKPPVLDFRVSVAWFRDRRVVAAGLAGLVAALGAAGVAVNRHLRLRRSHAEIERRVEERTSELRRATEALAHSQKMTALGTLAAGIAHDFNNILSIVKGSAQIIAANPQDHQKVLTRVSRILSMVDQASDLVKAMLGFGTATERKVKPCDLNGVVEGTVRLLSDRFRRDIAIELQLAVELPEGLAAADLLRQMLFNLIFNGADAMNGQGAITIRTGLLESLPAGLVLQPRPARCHVFVSVRDRGSGIAMDCLPRIFEPFFTTKAMADRPGRGLGLYMVHEFAREMGHGIQVESAVDQGSTFTLILPVAGETAD